MGDLLPFETNYGVLDLLPADPNISNQSLLDQCFDLDIGDFVNQTLSPAAQDSQMASGYTVDTSHTLSSLRLSELRHLPSALTDYFFKEVIKLYCTWDNSFNSLRIMIGRMWQSSGALYHIMQSMAAVCLSEIFPHLAATAMRERSCALGYLQQNSISPIRKEEHALATFLFGHSSSWFDPHDLATDKFQEAGALISSWSLPDNEFSWSFLEEAFDFWKMLLAFTTDTTNGRNLSRQICVSPSQLTGRRLVFSVRTSLPNVLFTNEYQIDFFRDTLEEAGRLEHQLLAFVAAEASCIVDPGDPNTPRTHFQHMDEAFRYTGLFTIIPYFPRARKKCELTSLATHVVQILQEIPFESLTRCIQPFVMVAVSGELRYNNQTPGSGSTLGASIETARARNFVKSRLAAYTHVLPLPKVQQHYQLVKDIWSAIDSGDEDVYWVDVASQKKLSPLMA
ncbi:hypothetical protein CEP52_012183 [Fusarium oligoseptatum]|uniref:Uncharacterized protein n=1 Tax=Fusarium oligoseptatum TaxID=2604345 RepID=A0A428SZE1_9HYPO|nr:hypothetical protein CEP52_012183 [Fusarium oligoseptatum]